MSILYANEGPKSHLQQSHLQKKKLSELGASGIISGRDGTVWCQVLIHISIPIKMCTEILLEKCFLETTYKVGFGAQEAVVRSSL